MSFLGLFPNGGENGGNAQFPRRVSQLGAGLADVNVADLE